MGEIICIRLKLNQKAKDYKLLLEVLFDLIGDWRRKNNETYWESWVRLYIKPFDMTQIIYLRNKISELRLRGIKEIGEEEIQIGMDGDRYVTTTELEQAKEMWKVENKKKDEKITTLQKQLEKVCEEGRKGSAEGLEMRKQGEGEETGD